MKRGGLDIEKKQQMIKIGAGVLFFILGWFLAVQPALGKLGSVKKMSQEAEERRELAREIEAVKKGFEKAEALLGETDRPKLLAQMTKFADEAGLEVLSMEPTEQSDTPYSRLVMTLKLRTRFGPLTHFLTRLEKMNPPMAVTQMRVGTASRRGMPAGVQKALEADLAAETLIKNKTP